MDKFNNGIAQVNVVIPARYNSQRFKNKLLQKVSGKTILQYTHDAAVKCSCVNEVVIAVDHIELYSCVKEFSDNVVMTSDKCNSGTERLSEVVDLTTHAPDIWINWQADEPLLTERHLNVLLSGFNNQPFLINTLAMPFDSSESWMCPDNVKVVVSSSGRAMYFSRACIPGSKAGLRSQVVPSAVYHHIGLYAFRHDFWNIYKDIKRSELTQIECLEQLDWLSHDVPFGVSLTAHESLLGIDTVQDFDRFKAIIESGCD